MDGGGEGAGRTVTVCVAATLGLDTTVMPRAAVAAVVEDSAMERAVTTLLCAAGMEEAIVAMMVTLPETMVTLTDEAATLARVAIVEVRAARFVLS